MRKRKLQKGFKSVRVDHKTIIEVPIDRPDDVAVSEYLEKINRGRPTFLGKRKTKEK